MVAMERYTTHKKCNKESYIHILQKFINRRFCIAYSLFRVGLTSSDAQTEL